MANELMHNVASMAPQDADAMKQPYAAVSQTVCIILSLSFFRSARYGRSWLQTAGVVLDAAALMQSTIDVDASPRAALCLRSGFVTLGNLADTFEVDRPADPQPGDEFSLQRTTFDPLCRAMHAVGIPLTPDLDQAWTDLSGWRVN